MSVEVKIVAGSIKFVGLYQAIPTQDEVMDNIEAQPLELREKAVLTTVVNNVKMWPRLGAALGFTRPVLLEGRKIGEITFTYSRNNILRM